MQIKRMIAKPYNDMIKGLSNKQKGELADYCQVSQYTFYIWVRDQQPGIAKPAYLNKIKEVIGVDRSVDITVEYKKKPKKSKIAA